MIVVIADDLSGAAELASAAAALGLRAEVHTTFNADSDADVVAVDTHTRSVSGEVATGRVDEATRAVIRGNPAWIYKKTDSVLRGNVRVEIEAILNATGKRRSLFIPANPAKGRIIRDGRYFIHGTPLAETAFARDPEHPRCSSIVRELLGSSEVIATPDAPHSESLANHARAVDDATLPAGGVEFFEALLRDRGVQSSQPIAPPTASGPSLFVCGSAAAWRLGRREDCRRFEIPFVAMPEALFRNPSDSAAAMVWQKELDVIVTRSRVVMAAVARGEIEPQVSPRGLVAVLAQVTAATSVKTSAGRIFLEGGATARAFLDARGWKCFQAFAPAGSGVAVLAPPADSYSGSLLLFIKPGSYPWPESIWPDSK